MKTKKKTLLIITLILTLVLTQVTALGAQSQNEPNAMRIGVTVQIDSLSPLISYSQIGYEVFMLMYDSLVTLDENLEPVGNLATHWELDSSETEWTFYLEEGVTWHDGEPFTASDVKFTYDMLIAEGLGMYAGALGGITEVLVEDDHTVVMKTEAPKANMLINATPILPEHIWSQVDPEDYVTWENSQPVGTGPFKFDELRSGEFLKLVANPDYFKGAPGIDELIYVLYANTDTMAQSMRIGEIDAATNFSPSQLSSLQNEPGIDAIAAVVLGFTELSFNAWDDPASNAHPLLSDFTIRHAIEYAIDKQSILDLVYAGQGSVGSTLIPPEGFYHYEPSPEEYRGFDLEKANQLLDDAGYVDLNGDGIRQDSDGTPLSFTFTLRANNTDEVQAGQMIAGTVAEAGIELNIETVDDGLLIDKIYSGDFDMFIWGWGTDLDPTTILNVMTTEQIGNMSDSNYSNERYDELFVLQQTLMDPEERQAVVWEMQQILYEEAPYIILFYDNSLQAVNTDRWTGWKTIPEEGGYFFNLTNYNYLNVQPAVAEDGPGAPSEGDDTMSDSNMTPILIGVAVIAAIAFFFVKKKKSQ